MMTMMMNIVIVKIFCGFFKDFARKRRNEVCCKKWNDDFEVKGCMPGFSLMCDRVDVQRRMKE